MSRLYISEFTETAVIKGREIPAINVKDKVTDQSVAIGATAASSNAFASNTGLVRIKATADCHVEFGATPTAVKTAGSEVGITLTAGEAEYVAVPAGSSYKLSVIATA